MADTNMESFKALQRKVSEGSGRIIAWVGAGMSRPAGLPTWRELHEMLCRVFRSEFPEGSSNLDKNKRAILDRAIEGKDFWEDFEAFETAGETTYRAVIREALCKSYSSKIPDLYKKMWRLPIAGVFNLNLDCLASRAFHEIYQGMKILHEFSGLEAGSHARIVASNFPFIASLHGTIENEKEWIFTRKSLDRLLNDPCYVQFVRSCIQMHTFIFLGLTVDDVAVGAHLSALRNIGMNAGPHYWITDRNDDSTRSWAEANGVRVINYASGRHRELNDFLEALVAPSADDSGPSIAISVIGNADHEILPPNELVLRPVDEIRGTLNSYAVSKFSGIDPDSPTFRDFVRRYDEAIYRSWYVTQHPPGNVVHGYRLDKKIYRGKFHKLYMATAPDNKTVAVKIIDESLRHSGSLMKSFRRGVETLRKLSDAGASGIPRFYLALEFPAMIVTDFVSGDNLPAAIKKGRIESWARVLEIASKIAGILKYAHGLPEPVIHHDLKPSHVILHENESGREEVVICDFDLALMIDPSEDDFNYGRIPNAYTAPEALKTVEGRRRVHSSVDVYGLAMTMYFIRTGSDPLTEAPSGMPWTERLEKEIAKFVCGEWKSLPARFARLISACSDSNPYERLNIQLVCNELERLLCAAKNPGGVVSASMIAEEMSARVKSSIKFHFDHGRDVAEGFIAEGYSINIQALEVSGKVRFTIQKASSTIDIKKSGALASKKINLLKTVMMNKGWSEVQPPAALASLEKPIGEIILDIDGTASSIGEAVACMG